MEMNNTMFAEVPEHEREAVLRDNCAKTEESTHFRQLTETEVEERKTKMLVEMNDLHRTEEELRETSKILRDKIKAHKDAINTYRDSINKRAEEVTERIYMFDDQDRGMMAIYNAQGTLLFNRPLKPEERQGNIISMSKKKTEDVSFDEDQRAALRVG